MYQSYIVYCGGKAERQVRRFSQRVQWTPLLHVISIFACEKPHSVALGLVLISYRHTVDPFFPLTDVFERLPFFELPVNTLFQNIKYVTLITIELHCISYYLD